MSYTAYDRFKDTIESRPKDRVPVIAGTILWGASNYPDAPYREIVKDAELITAAQLWVKDTVSFDLVYPTPDNFFIGEAFGCKIRYSEDDPILDPLPLKLKTLSDLDDIHFPNPREDGRFPVVLEAAKRLFDATGGTFPIMANIEGVFTVATRIIEPSQILRMTLKTPDVLDALLDKINRVLIDLTLALEENGVNSISMPEPTASSSMLSPRMFRRFVLPRLQEYTNEVNVPVMLHICGDTAPILDAMGESGAAILSLDQCMDFKEVRKVLPETVIAGNVDPVKSLLMGDTETVKQDALHCLQTMGAERYILMPGCGIPPKASIENLKAMVQAASDYGLGK
ncbi:uroporphyrinogen decarboxylase family protein [bacterium]|nr:uroporphyrinogen decarboxylase family protein [bacterium]